MEFEVFRPMVFSGCDLLNYGTEYFDTWEQAFRRKLLLSWYCEDEGSFFFQNKGTECRTNLNVSNNFYCNHFMKLIL
jgi:hypothetical protein